MKSSTFGLDLGQLSPRSSPRNIRHEEEIHQASEVNIYLNVLKTLPKKDLMMLTVSMTVSHLYQNLKIVKGIRSLK